MIDLRSELDKLFNTTDGGVARWVAIRHFTTEHSEYWKPETHEAVGGPAYKFNDVLVQTYSVPASRRFTMSGLETYEPGAIHTSLQLFIVQYSVDVKIDDELFELDYYAKEQPTLVYNISDVDIANGKVMPKTRYKVHKLEQYRDLEGRVEYQLIFGEKTLVR